MKNLCLLCGIVIVTVMTSCSNMVTLSSGSHDNATLPVRIWAHRGCCYAWPENTLQSFKAACELDGLTGIELDIQLTKDNKIVVIHDEKVDRTTNGTGNVCDFTLAELKALKIKTNSKYLIPQYTQIPTIEEVFELVKPYCLEYGLKINIELKNSVVRYEGMEDMIIALVKQYGLESYIVYSSFNPDSIVLIKQKNPDAQVGILHPSLKECLAFAENQAVDALHPAYSGRDVENVRDKTTLPIRMWNFPPDVPFYPNEGKFAIPDFRAIAEYGITDVFSNIPEAYLKKRSGQLAIKELCTPELTFDLCTEIAKSSGLYKKCGTNRMSDFHFYEVHAGDSFVFNAKGYEYQIAFYDDTVDERFIHTYCYSDEENWATYTQSIKPLQWKNHDTTFTEHGWARLVVRKKESLFKRGLSFVKKTRPYILTTDDKAMVEEHCHFVRKPVVYEVKPFFAAEIADTVQKVTALRGGDEAAHTDTLTFALLADTHYVINGHWEDTAHNLLEVHKKAPFDALIHLGDFTDGMTPIKITEEYFAIQNADMQKLGIPLYYALGNHDSNYFRNNPDRLTLGKQTELYLQRETPYYYVDYADKKLRLLILYSFDHTQEGQSNRYGFPDEEVAWIKQVLTETPNDWKVLVCSHVPLLAEMHYWSDAIRNGPQMVQVLEAFNSGSLTEGEKGRLLAFIHGHIHSDWVNTTSQSFPIVAVGCTKIEDDQVYKTLGSITYSRKIDDVTQDLWDVLVVNTKSGQLDFVRFGAGEDRTLIKKYKES